VKSVRVGTCAARSDYCRDVFDEFVLVSGRVRRGRIFVGTCPERSAYCRDVFGVVGFL